MPAPLPHQAGQHLTAADPGAREQQDPDNSNRTDSTAADKCLSLRAEVTQELPLSSRQRVMLCSGCKTHARGIQPVPMLSSQNNTCKNTPHVRRETSSVSPSKPASRHAAMAAGRALPVASTTCTPNAAAALMTAALSGRILLRASSRVPSMSNATNGTCGLRRGPLMMGSTQQYSRQRQQE